MIPIAPLLSFVLSPVGRWMAAGVAVLALVGAAELHGRHVGKVACEERVRIAVAAEQARQQAVFAATLQREQAAAAEREKQTADLQKQVQTYEDERAKQPPVAGCRIDRGNLERLRRFYR
jgi:hypothetical protein